VYTPPRRRARIVPPSPMTVAIDSAAGLPICYGVIANVSESGACVWTDGVLTSSSRLRLRVSFARLSEVHEIGGCVVWEAVERDARFAGMRRYGIEWLDASAACVSRLRELAMQAIDDRRTPTRPIAAIRPTAEH
jgi:hypothetical protein